MSLPTLVVMPADGAANPFVIPGTTRQYSCTAGSAITVPGEDANILRSQGWVAAGPGTTIKHVGATSSRPKSPDFAGEAYLDTSSRRLGALGRPANRLAGRDDRSSRMTPLLNRVALWAAVSLVLIASASAQMAPSSPLMDPSYAPAMVQPVMLSQLAFPASGTTAQTTWPVTGGGITPPVTVGTQASPIQNPGRISGLVVTGTANSTAGTVLAEFWTGTPAGGAATQDTGYGCSFNGSSGVATECKGTGPGFAVTQGQIVTIKFTSSGGSSWASLNVNVSWLFTPQVSQRGNIWTGTGNGATGANAVTGYLGPGIQLGSTTELAVTALDPPGLPIFVTGFTVYVSATDTSPGHDWYLVHNGSQIATFHCQTLANKTCSTPAGIAPVYIAPYDTFSVEYIGTSGSVTQVAQVALGFTPLGAPGESPLFALVQTGTQTGAFYNLAGGGYGQAQTTESTYWAVAPQATLIRVFNLVAFQTTQNASGKNRTFTLRSAGPWSTSPTGANLALTCKIPPSAASSIGGGALSGIICPPDLVHVSTPTPAGFFDWGMVADSGSTNSGNMRISSIVQVVR